MACAQLQLSEVHAEPDDAFVQSPEREAVLRRVREEVRCTIAPSRGREEDNQEKESAQRRVRIGGRWLEGAGRRVCVVLCMGASRIHWLRRLEL